MSENPDVSWIEFEDFFGRTVQPHFPRHRSCGWLCHDWDQGVDLGELNGGCMTTNTIRYTCRTCGKTKDRCWA